MINFIEGTLVEKNFDMAVINAGGVGYEIMISSAVYEKLGSPGQKAKLYVVESTSMYGGATVLYGFVAKEEKEIFLCFKEHIPNTGAKKAMDYVEKAGKSFADFKQAVQTQNVELLTTIFGFTRKTSEKLVNSLKERIGDVAFAGERKWKREAGSDFYSQAKAGLAALGYRNDEVERIISDFEPDEIGNISIEEFIKKVLKKVQV